MFLEYFAGRALALKFVRGNESDKKYLQQFLLQHKYNPRFRAALRFMMGESIRLQTNSAKQCRMVSQLLQLLDDPPHEVAGLQHLSLLSQVVNEWLCFACCHDRAVLRTIKRIQQDYSLELKFVSWLRAAIRLSATKAEDNSGRYGVRDQLMDDICLTVRSSQLWAARLGTTLHATWV